MTVLLVFRHTKSDWSADPAGEDIDRPLAKRGKKAAEVIGRFIASSGNVPDQAIHSPAWRVAETLERATKAGDWQCPIRVASSLYGGGIARIIGEVRAEPDSTEVLLVVGHEPDCSELVSTVIGGGSARMPTGALARIDCDVARWSELGAGSGTLAFLVTPRLLDRM